MRILFIPLLFIICFSGYSQKRKLKTKIIPQLEILTSYDKIDDRSYNYMNRNLTLNYNGSKFEITPLLKVNDDTKKLNLLGLLINSYNVTQCIEGIQLTLLYEINDRSIMYTYKDYNCKGEGKIIMDTIYSIKLKKYPIQTIRIQDFNRNYIYDIEITKSNKNYFVELFAKINEYNNKTMKL